MAQPVSAIATKSKDHRRRKNPRSADIFAAERKAQNASRPKQIWIESRLLNSETGESVRDAHWSRG